MPYSELMVAPMRQDLVRIGFKEMRTPEDVEGLLEASGTVLVAVNSVCGCSAGSMMERHQIEGRTPQEIAEDLKLAFEKHC